ncbi:MAG: hypothetical protein GXP22_07655 [Gammaproteobacteria bacterium]|nr:hypothetical protein [Gammaproteobacteria bacterium]
MYLRRATLVSAMMGVLMLSPSLYAEDWADKFSITGFASAAFQKSNSTEPFYNDSGAGVTDKGSWYGNRIGLNINAQINNRISLATQFLSSRSEENYSVHLDWGFIAIRATDELTLRAGKLKNPIGIVNEYRSVGYTYPWIVVPQLYYGEEMIGATVTREAYSGASLYWEVPTEDWLLSADLYVGRNSLEFMDVNNVVGLTVNGEWNDQILLQGSWYRGTMDDTSGSLPLVTGQLHSVKTLGTRIHIDNFIGYLEWADVGMGAFRQGKARSWYGTLGYQFGDIMPHISYQYYEKGLGTASPVEQSMTTLGLRYDWMPNMDIKFELSKIRTDQGTGLFKNAPGKDVKMVGIAVDVLF